MLTKHAISDAPMMITSLPLHPLLPSRSWNGVVLTKHAFYDAPMMITSINVVKDYILVGDVHNGVYFIRYVVSCRLCGAYRRAVRRRHNGVYFIRYMVSCRLCGVYRRMARRRHNGVYFIQYVVSYRLCCAYRCTARRGTGRCMCDHVHSCEQGLGFCRISVLHH